VMRPPLSRIGQATEAAYVIAWDRARIPAAAGRLADDE
jgi:hypothetical protein